MSSAMDIIVVSILFQNVTVRYELRLNYRFTTVRLFFVPDGEFCAAAYHFYDLFVC